ncbi:hypothetical protein BKA81DRAFT_361081 [Phyllosticta paracitricarpa]
MLYPCQTTDVCLLPEPEPESKPNQPAPPTRPLADPAAANFMGRIPRAASSNPPSIEPALLTVLWHAVLCVSLWHQHALSLPTGPLVQARVSQQLSGCH